MNQRVKDFFEKAQSLSPKDREELGELLLASVEVDFDFDKVWSAEAARRWDEHKSNGEKSVPALEAVEAARSSHKRPG